MKSIIKFISFFFLVYYTSLTSQNYIPFSGKWNADTPNDYVAVWKVDASESYGLLDGNGDGKMNSLTVPMGLVGDIPLAIDYQGDDRDEIALYRSSTREFIFYADYMTGEIALSRVVGNQGDQPIIGDWDGDGKDGFALYRPSTRRIWFYQNISDVHPFYSRVAGNQGDVIISGNWDGIGGDEFAIYRPSTRRFWFYETYDELNSNLSIQTGNFSDIPISGDWDGDGKDNFALYRPFEEGLENVFWIYNDFNVNASYRVSCEDEDLLDLSEGRQIFYTNGVPHIDSQGNTRTSYDPNLSFFPKGIYNIIPEDIEEIYNAGYNLGFLWPEYYPLEDGLKNTLDNLNNEFKTIVYFNNQHGGRAFTGKFNGGNKDHIGMSSVETNFIAYDLDGDKKLDTELKFGNNESIVFTGDWDGDGKDGIAISQIVQGNQTMSFYNQITPLVFTAHNSIIQTGDIPFSGDWDGNGEDSFVLYRPNERRLLFYQEIGDSHEFYSRVVGNLNDKVVIGDWNGDGEDGFALYRPSTRRFWFYQNYNSTEPFFQITFGDFGDIPISGDWDADGTDGIGVYRPTPLNAENEFWLVNEINNISGSLSSSFFKNPIIELNSFEHVFGMYTADEPRNHDITLDYLTDIYDEYSNLSTHVFFHVDDFIDTTDSEYDDLYEEWQNFARLGEAVGHDPYPLWNRSDTICSINYSINPEGIRQTGKEVANIIEQSREASNNQKPNWYVYQAFSEINGDTHDFYTPTPNQLGSMIYASIVHGATGIFSFAYDNPLFYNIKRKESHLPEITIEGISDNHNVSLWDKASEINSEIDILAPYILSVTPEKTNQNNYRLFISEAPLYEEYPIRTLFKTNTNGDLLIMAVNMTKQSFNTIIPLPHSISPANRIVHKLFEGDILTYAGSINDYFGPFDVHFYKIDHSSLVEILESEKKIVQKKLKERRTKIVTVYPNPSNTTFIFKIKNIDDSNIHIYDINGRLIKRLNKVHILENSNQYQWNFKSEKNIPSGVYFYQVNTNDGVKQRGKLFVK